MRYFLSLYPRRWNFHSAAVNAMRSTLARYEYWLHLSSGNEKLFLHRRCARAKVNQLFADQCKRAALISAIAGAGPLERAPRCGRECLAIMTSRTLPYTYSRVKSPINNCAMNLTKWRDESVRALLFGHCHTRFLDVYNFSVRWPFRFCPRHKLLDSLCTIRTCICKFSIKKNTLFL